MNIYKQKSSIANKQLYEALRRSNYPSLAGLAGYVGCKVSQLEYLIARKATPLTPDGRIKPHVAVLCALLGGPVEALFTHETRPIPETLDPETESLVADALSRVPAHLLPENREEQGPGFMITIAIVNTALSNAMKAMGPDLEKALGERGLLLRDAAYLEACQASPFDDAGNLTDTAEAICSALGVEPAILFPPDCPTLPRETRMLKVPVGPDRANACIAPIQTAPLPFDPLTERKKSRGKMVAGRTERGLHTRIRAAIRGLAPLQRGLVVLSRVNGMTSEDIAVHYGLDPAFVRAEYRAAVATLPSRAYLDALPAALGKGADRCVDAMEIALDQQTDS